MIGHTTSPDRRIDARFGGQASALQILPDGRVRAVDRGERRTLARPAEFDLSDSYRFERAAYVVDRVLVRAILARCDALRGKVRADRERYGDATVLFSRMRLRRPERGIRAAGRAAAPSR